MRVCHWLQMVTLHHVTRKDNIMTPEEEKVTRACIATVRTESFGLGMSIGVVVGLCLGLFIPFML